MSYQFYKILHLSGLVLTFMSLAYVFAVNFVLLKAEKSQMKLGVVFHGIGLFLALVGGFGLAARLGLVTGFPFWIYLKIAVWLLVGGALVLAKRMAKKGPAIYFVILSMFVLGAIIAVYKPM